MKLRATLAVLGLAVALAGSLTADDLTTYFPANLGRVTSVPNGEVVLSPCLSISPSRKTVIMEDSATMSASGSTNTITWFAIENPSGGSLLPTSSTGSQYQAGMSNTCVDILEAWDGDYRFARAYMNVISTSEVAQAGKAIIIAGTKGADDSLWTTTDYLADLSYNTFLYRGFSKPNVQYLNSVTNQDVDGNGLMDDIDMASTLANAGYSFTNWAANANKLFVYLVDHGTDSSGAGYFYLNSTEMLTASNLDLWLDTLQTAHTGMEVTVVIDCCNAGSFLDELTFGGTAKRIVISSCSSNQSTYFAAGGLVSFSDAFFCGLMQGLDLKQCFDLAGSSVSGYSMTSLLDDTKDGVYEPGTDGLVASGTYVGPSFIAGKDIPQIGLVCGNQLLTDSTRATLWADYVVSAYPIEEVWCLIISPSHTPDPNNPVSDIPELQLTYNSTNGRYEAAYSGFSEDGTYKVMYYAKDIWGSVSLPSQSYVTQSGYDERIILVAGGPTNLAGWDRYNKMANQAYHTFRSRWFDATNVYYLNPLTPQDLDSDGTNDVDETPTLENLANAITNWAGSTNFGGPANKLTIYLIGEGSNGVFRLNATQELASADLDYWTDVFQQSNADACVVMEFKDSDHFMASLTPPGEAKRVSVSACGTNSGYCCRNSGTVSFTQYLLSDVFSGYSIGQAFQRARNGILTASGIKVKQDALIDDNGDGVYTANVDGELASQWHFGTAFMTGADNPVIDEVTPDSWLKGPGSLLLWASGVTDMQGVSNVWCLITAPDYDGLSDLPQTNLTWNPDTRRHEVLYTNFTQMGTYACTFLAMDNSGEISSPMQCEVLVSDAYESDDTKTQAVAFAVGQTQRHNFHAWNDEDWVMFYAVTNKAFYQIDVTQRGTNVDAAFDLYFEEADGSLTHLWTENNQVRGTGVVETFTMSGHDSGFYYLRVRPADTNSWGPDSEYDLDVWVPEGGNVLLVLGINGLTAGPLPSGIKAHLEPGADEQEIGGVTSVSFSKADGTYTVTLTGVPAGWDYVAYSPSQQLTVSGAGVNLAYASFVLVPMIRAEGVVRDAWTGEPLTGANLQWTATSGRIAGQTAATTWASESSGNFPTNVLLMTENWNLSVTKSGYSNVVLGVAGAAMSPGAVSNLGWVSLAPVDLNTNGIADSWEASTFGVLTNVTAIGDDDGDGLSNQEEYWVGTDPKSGASSLKMEDVDNESQTNGITLRWAVVNGRSYQVVATNALGAGGWPVVAGPWTAAAGQTNMSWTETNTAAGAKFYRMKVMVP